MDRSEREPADLTSAARAAIAAADGLGEQCPAVLFRAAAVFRSWIAEPAAAVERQATEQALSAPGALSELAAELDALCAAAARCSVRVQALAHFEERARHIRSTTALTIGVDQGSLVTLAASALRALDGDDSTDGCQPATALAYALVGPPRRSGAAEPAELRELIAHLSANSSRGPEELDAASSAIWDLREAAMVCREALVAWASAAAAGTPGGTSGGQPPPVPSVASGTAAAESLVQGALHELSDIPEPAGVAWLLHVLTRASR